MPKDHKRSSRRSTPRQDGSFLIRYRGQHYAVRLRRHVETDTLDVVSIWSEAWQSPVPIPPPLRGNRWEALLAGYLNRTVEEALQAAERIVGAWLDPQETEQHPRAG